MVLKSQDLIILAFLIGDQMEKDEPQPQVVVALGLSTTKREPSSLQYNQWLSRVSIDNLGCLRPKSHRHLKVASSSSTSSAKSKP